MLELEPTRVFRGTWDEIVLHKDEIPLNTLIELRVYDVPPNTQVSRSSPPRRGIAEVIREIVLVEGLPDDLSTNPKHMEGFGHIHSHSSHGEASDAPHSDIISSRG